MGGKNIPLKRHQSLFENILSSQDDRSIKNAMDTTAPGEPSLIIIRIHYRGTVTLTLIRVDLLDHHYLLAGWKIPDNLIPHPSTRRALC
jgi:hypothetical protein